MPCKVSPALTAAGNPAACCVSGSGAERLSQYHQMLTSNSVPFAGEHSFCRVSLNWVCRLLHTRQHSRLLHLVLPPLLPHLVVLHCQAQRLGTQHMQLLWLQPQDVALTLCRGCELVLAGHHFPNEVCGTQQCYLLKPACQAWQPPSCGRT